MWTCQHCSKQFEFQTTSEKANHSRWCEHNPKRNEWNKAKGAISQFGEIKTYMMECECCRNNFKIEEREKLHPQKDKYFCSRSCANNRQAWWNGNAIKYRTIAFQHWEKKCSVCSFDKIVEVHHVDEDRNNNDPQNLLPLCPNHHQMFHSPYREEMKHLIEEAIQDRMGL